MSKKNCLNKSNPIIKKALDRVGDKNEILLAKAVESFGEDDFTYIQLIARYHKLKNMAGTKSSTKESSTFRIDNASVEAQLENSTVEQRKSVEKLEYLKSQLSVEGEHYIFYDENNNKRKLTRVSRLLDNIARIAFDNENYDPLEFEDNRQWGNQTDQLLNLVIQYNNKEEVLREYTRWIDNTGTENLLSDEVIDQVVTEFLQIYEDAQKNGDVILSQVPFYNISKSAGGTTDVILVTKEGRLKIVDLKTSNKPTQGEYEVIGKDGKKYTNAYDLPFSKKKGSKKERHSYQQSFYMAMAQAMGFEVDSISIMPLHVTPGTDGRTIDQVTIEPTIPLEPVEDVLSEYSIDDTLAIPIFEDYRDDFSDMVKKILKFVSKKIRDTRIPKEEARLRALKDTLENSVDQLKLVSDFVDDAYKMVFGGKESLSTGRTYYRRGFLKAINDVENMSPEEAIKTLMQLKGELELYGPMLREVRLLYTNVLSKELGSMEKAQENSLLDKIQKVSAAIETLDSNVVSRINPLLGQTLAKFKIQVQETDPKIAAQIASYERRMNASHTTPAKKNMYARKIKELKRAVNLTADDITEILEEGGIEDLNIVDAYLHSASMSGNQIVALYAKKIKYEYYKMNDRLRRAGLEASEILQETVDTAYNPVEQNEGLFKTARIYMRKDKDEGYVYENKLVFLNPYNYDKFNKDVEAMLKEADNKYPEKDSKERRAFITEWYKNNTVSPGAKDVKIKNAVLFEGVETIKKGIEQQVQDGLISRNRANKTLDLMLNEDGEIRADNWIARDFRLPADKYRDAEYDALKGKKKKLYEYILSEYLNDQNKFPERRRSQHRFILPYVPKGATDQFGAYIREQGMGKGLWSSAKRFAKSKFTVEADREYDYIRENHKTIPQVFSRPIPNNEVSVDLLSSMLLFKKAAETYEVQNELAAMSEALYSSVENMETYSRSVYGELFEAKAKFTKKTDKSNVSKMLRAFIDTVVYGETKDSDNPELAKLANSLMGFIAFTGLGGPFGVIANTANWLQGSAMVTIEATANQYFGANSYKNGQARAIKHMGSTMLKDALEPVSKSLTGQLIDAFDAIQGDFYNQFGHKISQKNIKKHFDTDKWFLLQNMGEYQMQVAAMEALMSETKVKTNEGETVSLRDAYYLDLKGRLAIKPNIDKESMGPLINDLVPLNAQTRLHYINKEMHGVYNKLDAPIIKKKWWGSLLFFYRNWYVPGMKRRYKRASYIEEAGEWNEGMYRTFFRALFTEFSTMAKAGFGWADADNQLYSPMERANMRKTSVELAFIISLAMLTEFLKSMADAGDDDERHKFLQLAVISRRLNQEMSQFINPLDNFRTISSPTFALNTVRNMVKFVEIGLGDVHSLATEGDIQRYKSDAGWFSKGDSKLMAQFFRVFGATAGKNLYTTPEDALKVMEYKR